MASILILNESPRKNGATMVFHDQSLPVTDEVQKLDQELSCLDLNNKF